jgi:hypothetical protein
LVPAHACLPSAADLIAEMYGGTFQLLEVDDGGMIGTKLANPIWFENADLLGLGDDCHDSNV